MKEAMELALDALEYWDVQGGLHQPTEDAITAIKAALAQPEQDTALSWLGLDRQPHYTLQAQRPWVGLTEAKIKEIWLNGKDYGDDWLDVLALARAFEAELKEKNT